MLYTIMLFYSFTADRAVYAVALRPPIQRAYVVAQNTPSASPAGSSLVDALSSLARIETKLQVIETTQADQGAALKVIETTQADQGAALKVIETTQADQGAALKGLGAALKSTDNKVVAASCTVPLASAYANLAITLSTFGKHTLSTEELCMIASQTIGVAVGIFAVIYTILVQIEKNQKTP